jgi:hypothetical protein
MWRALRCGFVVVACLGWAMACSGAFSPASADDAGADVTTVLPVEAAPPVDAFVPDTSVSDAGLDAPVDVLRPSPCVGPKLFCDDFEDKSNPLGVRWDEARQSAGTFQLEGAQVVSGTGALRLGLTPGMGARSSDLKKVIDVPTPNVRVSFDVALDLADGSFGLVEPIFVEPQPFPAGVSFQVFEIVVDRDGPHFEAYRALSDGGATANRSPLTIAPRKYAHGELELRHANGTLTAQMKIDGQMGLPQSFVTPQPTRIVLRVGAPYTRDVSGAGTIRFDDVVVEAL